MSGRYGSSAELCWRGILQLDCREAVCRLEWLVDTDSMCRGREPGMVGTTSLEEDEILLRSLGWGEGDVVGVRAPERGSLRW